MKKALMWLTLLSCTGVPGAGNYAGNPCSSIPLGKPPFWLQLAAPAPSNDRLGRPSPYITVTHDAACCVQSPFFPRPEGCAVDCDALYARLTVTVPIGDFPPQPCGTPPTFLGTPAGTARCTVYLDGEEIVAVNTFCAD